MREFQYITRGRIMKELKKEGLEKINLSQLQRLEDNGVLPKARRAGGGWRAYTRIEAYRVKNILWKWYAGRDPEYKIPTTLYEL